MSATLRIFGKVIAVKEVHGFRLNKNDSVSVLKKRLAENGLQPSRAQVVGL